MTDQPNSRTVKPGQPVTYHVVDAPTKADGWVNLPRDTPTIEVYKPGAAGAVQIEVLPGRVEPCPQCQQLLGYHFPVVLFATRQETAWRVRLVCPVGGQRYVLPHDFGPVGDSKGRP